MSSLLAPLAAQSVAVLPAVADATLYEDSAGSLASGSGPGLFAGVNGRGDRRRSLVRFDLSTIPAGAHVVAVELRLFVSRSNWTSPLALDAHRVFASWGEGPSVASGGGGAGGSALAGDATWAHRSWPNVTWSTLGGDCTAVPSATCATPQVGLATWASTPSLVADVQTWLDQPTTNCGWLLKTTEAGAQQIRRLDSREQTASPQVPELRVTFVAPGQFGSVGQGCGAGPLSLAASGVPAQGGSVTFTAAAVPMNALAAMFAGFGVDPVPPQVVPGCLLLPHAPLNLGFVVGGASGTFARTIAVPPGSGLFGLPLCVQAWSFDPAVAAVANSPAVVVVIG